MPSETERANFEQTGTAVSTARGIVEESGNERRSMRRSVHARGGGREAWIGSVDGRAFARGLGWLGIAIGAAELLAPGAVAKAIGLRPSGGTNGVLRALGVRELVSGAGIVANPGSKEWVATRTGGDVMDLALLGLSLAKSRRPSRTLIAAAAVLGITALDLWGSERIAESRKVRAPAGRGAAAARSPVLRSITIGCPRAEVYARWRDLASLPRFMENIRSIEVISDTRSRWRAASPAGSNVEWQSEIVEDEKDEAIAWRSVEGSTVYHSGRVTFEDAPRGEGTVVRVEMSYAPPGGKIASALLKVLRKEPGQQIGDDLRRFKQIMETGEVLVSDASAKKALGPHAAKPPEASELTAANDPVTPTEDSR